MVSRSSMHHSMRGFTLVELMVVIAVIAILAALAAPSFTDFIAKQRVKSAAYDLAQTLQTARSNAILNRRSVDVRASYPNSPTATDKKWNGDKTGTLFATDVTVAAESAKIAKSSFYVLESGTGLSSAGTTDNRVTKVSTLNDKVTVKGADGSTRPVFIRFTPSSAVQTSTSTVSGVAPTSMTPTEVTFVVEYTGSSTGYTVTLNHFGGVQVSKN